ncbi:MAG TPA: class I SAM-dependent methyltransferase [Dermatophilaceae bacterium]|nr:class I SAM-dependent methyltransferase [Dermatophilaceae bacterium]
MTGPVLAAHSWPSNADLIADVARLGYLKPTDRILDPTYGRGVWWKRWMPAELVTNMRAEGGWDFREIPFPDGHFDAVGYDPPYVCIGGRKTTGMPEFHNRFGLDETPTSPRGLQELINAGLAECHRVVRPSGIVLVKCQDYITSGQLWPGTHHTLVAALDLGFVLVDRLERIQRNPRPQPGNRWKGGVPSTQQHARRNLSTLFVLRRVQPLPMSPALPFEEGAA